MSILHSLECAYTARRFLCHTAQVGDELRAFEGSETGKTSAIIDDDIRVEFVEKAKGCFMSFFIRPLRISFHNDAFCFQLVSYALVS